MSSIVPTQFHANQQSEEAITTKAARGKTKDEQLRIYKELQELDKNGQLSRADIRTLVELELALEQDENAVILQLGLADDSESQDSQKTTEDEEEDEHPVTKFQRAFKAFFDKYGSYISGTLSLLIGIGYFVYLGFAIAYDANQALAVTVITALVVLALIYRVLRDKFEEEVNEYCCVPLGDWWDKNFFIIKWFLYPALIIGLILYLVFDVLEYAIQLQSLSGIVIFITWTYLTCKYPKHIYWRPVIWGYALQIVFAVLVLRWEPGYNFVKWLSEVITKFCNFAYDGSAVVFGDPWMIFHAFTFMGSALIIWIGMIMGLLYYYHITQVCAVKMGWLFQVSTGTTAIESLAISSNIFLNGLDTMLMLRPYLTKLTKSEFHAFLVGGHCTVAGFAFGLFVLFGAPPEHVLSAACMSAPAAIAISKLNFPETEESRTNKMEDIQMTEVTDINVFEASANGAYLAGRTAAITIINYISSIAFLSFIDSALGYMGGLVGWDELGLAWICSVVFWPLALIMGVEVAYCWDVAKIIGMKILCNEILAFQILGQDFRAGLLDERSTAIATYAICGFSSLSTLFISVGCWNCVCPSRLNEMTSQMARIIVNANLACFMTASVAGLMYVPQEAETSLLSYLVNTFISAIPGWRDIVEMLPI